MYRIHFLYQDLKGHHKESSFLSEVPDKYIQVDPASKTRFLKYRSPGDVEHERFYAELSKKLPPLEALHWSYITPVKPL
jgi:hypothetical protein